MNEVVQFPGLSGQAPIATGGGGPHDPDMDARVTRLEEALSGINVTLGRLDERMNHLSTKADVEQVRTSVASLAARLDAKADKADLALIDGQVRSLPTLPKLSALAALTVICVGLVEWGLKHL